MTTQIEMIVEEMLSQVRPGRAGWKEAARARLRAEVTQLARQLASAEAEARRAEAEARQAEDEARKAAETVWRVVPQMWIYPWSGELYGYSVVHGGGHLTKAEAEVEAEALRRRYARRIQEARASWNEYMR